MKQIIHINQHNIKHNRKVIKGDIQGEILPVITSKTYKDNQYSNSVSLSKDGVEFAKIVYRPEKPLSCGAQVWIEIDTDQIEITPSE